LKRLREIFRFRRLLTSTTLVMIFGVFGLVSLFTPWAVEFYGESYWHMSSFNISGVDLLMSPYDPRPIVIFFLFSCVACIATPFLTRDPSRRGWRGPLYVFYAFLSVLAIQDTERWIGIPRLYFPEFSGSFGQGIGISLVWAMVIGLSIVAIIAFLEKRPVALRVDSIFAGAASGAVVLYSFFKVGWVFHPLQYVPGYSLTGFDLGYEYWSDLRQITIPYVDAVLPRLRFFLWPMVLYGVAALAVLIAIAPTFGGENRRVELPRLVHLVCGAVLVSFSLTVIAFASDLQIQNGLLFTLAAGLFLVLYQTMFLVSKHAFSKTHSTRAALAIAVCMCVGIILVAYNQPIERNVLSNQYFTFMEKYPFMSRIVQNDTEYPVFNFYTPVSSGGASDLTLTVSADKNLTVSVKSEGGRRPYPDKIEISRGGGNATIRFFFDGPHEILVSINETLSNPFAEVYMRLDGLTYQRNLQVVTIENYPYSALGWALTITASAFFVLDKTRAVASSSHDAPNKTENSSTHTTPKS